MTARTKTRGWRRLFEGWGAGVLLLLIAGSSIVLALPRAVPPREIPAPQIDRRALADTLAVDDELARESAREPLDVDVRAVGRELRSYNEAAAAGDERALIAARSRLVTAASKALQQGDRPLLVLRAYQMLRFVDEVRRWEETGEVGEELTALGGDFMTAVVRSGWCRASPRRLILDEPTLRAFFKKRWNDVVGLRGPVFDLTLDEDRLRYGFLLRHPFRPEVGSSQGETARLVEVLDNRQRLEIIGRLGARDDLYPALFARGVVHYQMGEFARAGDAFRQHLELAPDGPYTLRARNHLKAALDQSQL